MFTSIDICECKTRHKFASINSAHMAAAVVSEVGINNELLRINSTRSSGASFMRASRHFPAIANNFSITMLSGYDHVQQ